MPEFTKPTAITVTALEDWNAGAQQYALNAVVGHFFQHGLEFAAAHFFQAAAHHIHAKEKESQTADQA